MDTLALKKYALDARALLVPRVFAVSVGYFTVMFVLATGTHSAGPFLLGILALAAWCVCSSALGVLAEFETQRRHGRGDTEAPVMNALRAPELQVVAVGAGIVALVLVAAFGFVALGIMLIALGVNYLFAYLQVEKPDLRVNTSAALLPIGYVVLPMLLGTLATGQMPPFLLMCLILANYALFVLLVRKSTASL